MLCLETSVQIPRSWGALIRQKNRQGRLPKDFKR